MQKHGWTEGQFLAVSAYFFSSPKNLETLQSLY